MASQKNIGKILIYVCIFLFLAIVACSIFLLTSKNTNKKGANTAVPTATPEDKEKTYTDSNYRYSVTYPSSLTLKNETSNSIFIDQAEVITWLESMRKKNPNLFPIVEITVYKTFSESNAKYTTLDDFVQENKCEETTINNTKGYLCTTTAPSKFIYVQKNDLIYKINFDMKTDYSTIQKNIINSIKFN